MKEWYCRWCKHRWEAKAWRRCPRCNDLRVWCLSGVWWKENVPPWSRVPDDVPVARVLSRVLEAGLGGPPRPLELPATTNPDGQVPF